MKYGLDEQTILKIQGVLAGNQRINCAILYGSRAKGNFRPGSDIDLTLEAPSLRTDDLLSLENQLDDLLLPYKIDLSLLHQIESKELLDHIKRVGIEFWKSSS